MESITQYMGGKVISNWGRFVTSTPWLGAENKSVNSCLGV